MRRITLGNRLTLAVLLYATFVSQNVQADCGTCKMVDANMAATNKMAELEHSTHPDEQHHDQDYHDKVQHHNEVILMKTRKLVVACIVGFDDQIYRIIDEVIKDKHTANIIVFFYMYKDCSFTRLIVVRTDFKTLLSKLAKYTHYFCMDKDYVESHICDVNDCIYIDKALIEPILHEEAKTHELPYVIIEKFDNKVPFKTCNINTELDSNMKMLDDKISVEKDEKMVTNDENISVECHNIYDDIITECPKPQKSLEEKIPSVCLSNPFINNNNIDSVCEIETYKTMEDINEKITNVETEENICPSDKNENMNLDFTEIIPNYNAHEEESPKSSVCKADYKNTPKESSYVDYTVLKENNNNVGFKLTRGDYMTFDVKGVAQSKNYKDQVQVLDYLPENHNADVSNYNEYIHNKDFKDSKLIEGHVDYYNAKYKCYKTPCKDNEMIYANEIRNHDYKIDNNEVIYGTDTVKPTNSEVAYEIKDGSEICRKTSNDAKTQVFNTDTETNDVCHGHVLVPFTIQEDKLKVHDMKGVSKIDDVICDTKPGSYRSYKGSVDGIIEAKIIDHDQDNAREIDEPSSIEFLPEKRISNKKSGETVQTLPFNHESEVEFEEIHLNVPCKTNKPVESHVDYSILPCEKNKKDSQEIFFTEQKEHPVIHENVFTLNQDEYHQQSSIICENLQNDPQNIEHFIGNRLHGNKLHTVCDSEYQNYEIAEKIASNKYKNLDITSRKNSGYSILPFEVITKTLQGPNNEQDLNYQIVETTPDMVSHPRYKLLESICKNKPIVATDTVQEHTETIEHDNTSDFNPSLFESMDIKIPETNKNINTPSHVPCQVEIKADDSDYEVDCKIHNYEDTTVPYKVIDVTTQDPSHNTYEQPVNYETVESESKPATLPCIIHTTPEDHNTYGYELQVVNKLRQIGRVKSYYNIIEPVCDAPSPCDTIEVSANNYNSNVKQPYSVINIESEIESPSVFQKGQSITNKNLKYEEYDKKYDATPTNVDYTVPWDVEETPKVSKFNVRELYTEAEVPSHTICDNAEKVKPLEVNADKSQFMTVANLIMNVASHDLHATENVNDYIQLSCENYDKRRPSSFYGLEAKFPNENQIIHEDKLPTYDTQTVHNKFVNDETISDKDIAIPCEILTTKLEESSENEQSLLPCEINNGEYETIHEKEEKEETSLSYELITKPAYENPIIRDKLPQSTKHDVCNYEEVNRYEANGNKENDVVIPHEMFTKSVHKTHNIICAERQPEVTIQNVNYEEINSPENRNGIVLPELVTKPVDKTQNMIRADKIPQVLSQDMCNYDEVNYENRGSKENDDIILHRDTKPDNTQNIICVDKNPQVTIQTVNYEEINSNEVSSDKDIVTPELITKPEDKAQNIICAEKQPEVTIQKVNYEETSVNKYRSDFDLPYELVTNSVDKSQNIICVNTQLQVTSENVEEINSHGNRGDIVLPHKLINKTVDETQNMICEDRQQVANQDVCHYEEVNSNEASGDKDRGYIVVPHELITKPVEKTENIICVDTQPQVANQDVCHNEEINSNEASSNMVIPRELITKPVDKTQNKIYADKIPQDVCNYEKVSSHEDSGDIVVPHELITKPENRNQNVICAEQQPGVSIQTVNYEEISVNNDSSDLALPYDLVTKSTDKTQNIICVDTPPQNTNQDVCHYEKVNSHENSGHTPHELITKYVDESYNIRAAKEPEVTSQNVNYEEVYSNKAHVCKDHDNKSDVIHANTEGGKTSLSYDVMTNSLHENQNICADIQPQVPNQDVRKSIDYNYKSNSDVDIIPYEVLNSKPKDSSENIYEDKLPKVSSPHVDDEHIIYEETVSKEIELAKYDKTKPQALNENECDIKQQAIPYNVDENHYKTIQTNDEHGDTSLPFELVSKALSEHQDISAETLPNVPCNDIYHKYKNIDTNEEGGDVTVPHEIVTNSQDETQHICADELQTTPCKDNETVHVTEESGNVNLSYEIIKPEEKTLNVCTDKLKTIACKDNNHEYEAIHSNEEGGDVAVRYERIAKSQDETQNIYRKPSLLTVNSKNSEHKYETIHATEDVSDVAVPYEIVNKSQDEIQNMDKKPNILTVYSKNNEHKYETIHANEEGGDLAVPYEIVTKSQDEIQNIDKKPNILTVHSEDNEHKYETMHANEEGGDLAVPYEIVTKSQDEIQNIDKKPNILTIHSEDNEHKYETMHANEEGGDLAVPYEIVTKSQDETQNICADKIQTVPCDEHKCENIHLNEEGGNLAVQEIVIKPQDESHNIEMKPTVTVQNVCENRQPIVCETNHKEGDAMTLPSELLIKPSDDKPQVMTQNDAKQPYDEHVCKNEQKNYETYEISAEDSRGHIPIPYELMNTQQASNHNIPVNVESYISNADNYKPLEIETNNSMDYTIDTKPSDVCEVPLVETQINYDESHKPCEVSVQDVSNRKNTPFNFINHISYDMKPEDVSDYKNKEICETGSQIISENKEDYTEQKPCEVQSELPCEEPNQISSTSKGPLDILKDVLVNYIVSSGRAASLDQPTTVDIGNICLDKSKDISESQATVQKCDNPDIDLKCWPSLLNILRAKIMFEPCEKKYTNFLAIVKKSSNLDPMVVQDIAKNAISKSGDEPIVVKNYNEVHNAIDILKNDVTNKRSILWPTLVKNC